MAKQTFQDYAYALRYAYVSLLGAVAFGAVLAGMAVDAKRASKISAAEAACKLLPPGADRIALDGRFARSMAASVLGPIPKGVALAAQVDGELVSQLFLADAEGCVLVETLVQADVWPRAEMFLNLERWVEGTSVGPDPFPFGKNGPDLLPRNAD